MSTHFSDEAQNRLEALDAERELVKSRWERYELTGEALDHSDITAWTGGLNDTPSGNAESDDSNTVST